MKAKEIHELSENEVEKKLRDSRDAHVKLRMSKQTGQVEETHKIKQLRRDIARLETILKREKACEHICLNNLNRTHIMETIAQRNARKNLIGTVTSRSG